MAQRQTSFGLEPIFNLHKDAWTRRIHTPVHVCAWVAHGRGHGPYTLRWHTYHVSAHYAWARVFRPAYGRK